MKKIPTPNHKLYEQYYLDQTKQKYGNLLPFIEPDFSGDMI